MNTPSDFLYPHTISTRTRHGNNWRKAGNDFLAESGWSKERRVDNVNI